MSDLCLILSEFVPLKYDNNKRDYINWLSIYYDNIEHETT